MYLTRLVQCYGSGADRLEPAVAVAGYGGRQPAGAITAVHIQIDQLAEIVLGLHQVFGWRVPGIVGAASQEWTGFTQQGSNLLIGDYPEGAVAGLLA